MAEAHSEWRRRALRARRAGLGALVSTIVLAAWVNAQEDDRTPLTVDSARGPIMVLPSLASPGSTVDGDIRFEISVEDGFRVLRAHQDGDVRTVYEPVDGPARRYAYDPAQRRFDKVTSTLRVRLADAERLDEVVASSGALRGKNYPALGWALLHLPAKVNPANVARTLAENPIVLSTEVVLKEPLRVPQ